MRELAQSIADSCQLTSDLSAVLLARHDSDAVRVTSTIYLVLATGLALRGIDATTMQDSEVSRLMADIDDLIAMAASRIKAESN